MRFDRQRALGLQYKGLRVDCGGDRLGLVVEDKILLELKTVERFSPFKRRHPKTFRLSALPVQNLHPIEQSLPRSRWTHTLRALRAMRSQNRGKGERERRPHARS
jgi:hypothetical protein